MTVNSNIPPLRNSTEHADVSKVLVVSADRHDRASLRQILRGSPCAVSGAGNCRQAISRLGRVGVAIVVCDCDLPDGTWLDILNRVASAPDSPYLIVTSRAADERLWAEVLNLGGFDILAKPFAAAEVLHVVNTALLRKHDTVIRAA